MFFVILLNECVFVCMNVIRINIKCCNKRIKKKHCTYVFLSVFSLLILRPLYTYTFSCLYLKKKIMIAWWRLSHETPGKKSKSKRMCNLYNLSSSEKMQFPIKKKRKKKHCQLREQKNIYQITQTRSICLLSQILHALFTYVTQINTLVFSIFSLFSFSLNLNIALL